MGKHSLDTPGRKRKDLDATKLSWLDVAIKVITLATVTVKLIAVVLTWVFRPEGLNRVPVGWVPFYCAAAIQRRTVLSCFRLMRARRFRNTLTLGRSPFLPCYR